ncbi:RICIN domain-containing protein, partial [Streptomyces bungoensis]
PRRIIWFGPKEQRPYTLSVLRSGVEPLPVEGTYVQRGFLPRWLATFFGVITALAITFVMLWIAYKPNVNTGATEKVVEAGSTLAPSPTPTPALTPAPPPPSAAAESPKAASDGGGGGGGSGGGGGGSPAAPKKPATPVVPATNVLLFNPTTKKCADLPNYDKGSINGPVREFTCDGTTHDNQLWNLEVKYAKGGPGGRALFQIRNVKDQLCMDLPDHGAQPVRTAVTEFTCDGTTADNQLWWVQKQQDGAYWIRNFASDNKCLDVAGYSVGGNDANLTIFDCSSTDDQEWRIVHPANG